MTISISEKHGAAPCPIGDAADERRRQKLAAGVAAEQQADEFDWDARNLVRPYRKKRYEYAVRHGRGEVPTPGKNGGPSECSCG